MRTGSNHLEESLNTLSDVVSHGEIFNPVFLGAHNREELFGITMAMREADPFPLLRAVLAQSQGLPGFRFFYDHDPRVIDTILNNPRIGKVILTRNPLDSYVSFKIAAATGQWRLTNPKMAKSAKATFDGAEFSEILSDQRAFRDRIQTALQVTGQAAFWIAYEQIGDLDVLNGLAQFLGSADRLAEVPGKLKKQNPGDTRDKVDNPEEMQAFLQTLDPFLLSRSVNLEPSRGPAVPTMIAAAESPLLYLPVPGGPTEAVRNWLHRLDGAPPREGLSQKELRPWMRGASGLTTFSVLRHPLVRAYGAWQSVLAEKGPKGNDIRRILRNQHAVPLPEDDGADAHAEGFLAFLKFLKANLGGQSALKVLPTWATQTEILAGMAQAVLPQRLIRDADAHGELGRLADQVGRQTPPFTDETGATGVTLAQIHTPEQDTAVMDAYRRDFIQFGFGPWSAN